MTETTLKTLVPNVPSPEGIALGAHLARFVERELAADPGREDGRCGSCAFRAGTHPNGCLGTVGDALKCVVEGDVFLCHEDAFVGQEKPCRGWAILAAAGERSKSGRRMPWPYSDEVER